MEIIRSENPVFSIRHQHLALHRRPLQWEKGVDNLTDATLTDKNKCLEVVISNNMTIGYVILVASGRRKAELKCQTFNPSSDTFLSRLQWQEPGMILI